MYHLADINDPSYECQDYREQIGLWHRLEAIAKGSWIKYQPDGSIDLNTSEVKKYIPPFQSEEYHEYCKRILNTPYDDQFQQTLIEFTNLIFSGGVNKIDFSPSLQQFWNNVDLQQNNGDTFLYQFILDGIRDGHRFLMINYSGNKEPRNLKEFKTGEYRPYWLSIDPRNVINFRTTKINNIPELVQVVIKESEIVQGKMGEETQFYYRRYYLGEDEKTKQRKLRWELYEGERRAPNQPYIPAPLKNRQPIEQGESFMPFIPLFFLPFGKVIRWGRTEPSLKSLAELNLQLYKDTSDYNYKHHMTNVDMLVMRNNPITDEKIVLAPGRTINLQEGQDVAWLSLDPTGLNISRQKIADIEGKINFIRTEFLKRPSDRQAAFTTYSQLTAINSKLESMVLQFCENMQLVLNITNALYHDTTEIVYTPDGKKLQRQYQPKIVLNPDIQRPSADNPQLALFYQGLAESRIISQAVYKEILKEFGFLPDWYNPERDAQQILNENPPDSNFSITPEVFKIMIEAVSKDFLDKETAFEILQAAGQMPITLNPQVIIERTGRQMSIEPVGAYLSQPIQENAIQSKVDPNKLLTLLGKLQKSGTKEERNRILSLITEYLDNNNNDDQNQYDDNNQNQYNNKNNNKLKNDNNNTNNNKE